jgi:hypothetical protein
MRRFGWIQGAKAPETSWFSSLCNAVASQIGHIPHGNRKDGEMAAICCVSALNRAASPLFARFRASLCHFSRQIHRIYES